jgi:hypothetical protein
MKIIIHRVNKIAKLQEIPKDFGVEIDVRGYGRELYLNHDPIDNPRRYEKLEKFLACCAGRFVIFNVKEAGYEDKIIALAKKYKIRDYFLLDVEFPYLYRATRKDKFKKIAVRYSEAEPIENVKVQIRNGKTLLDWVWIDTNTRLPLDVKTIKALKAFKTCLVCPERWGRPNDISRYIAKMKKLNFKPSAVMTSLEQAAQWNKF